MKLLGSAKKDVDKDEDTPKLESDEVVLTHCNLVSDSSQQASKVFFTFVPNKQFGQLIAISFHSLTIKPLTQNFNTFSYGSLIKIIDLLK